MILRLADLTADLALQARAGGIDAAIAAGYAERMIGGDVFPAITVYRDCAGVHWLADGFHRAHSARLAGLDALEAVVIPGERRDALLHALGANASHGLQRSSADKRRAVELLLADPEWAAWSDRVIAKRLVVSPTFVGGIRTAVPASGGPTVHVDSWPTKTRGADGKLRSRQPQLRKSADEATGEIPSLSPFTPSELGGCVDELVDALLQRVPVERRHWIAGQLRVKANKIDPEQIKADAALQRRIQAIRGDGPLPEKRGDQKGAK